MIASPSLPEGTSPRKWRRRQQLHSLSDLPTCQLSLSCLPSSPTASSFSSSLRKILLLPSLAESPTAFQFPPPSAAVQGVKGAASSRSICVATVARGRPSCQRVASSGRYQSDLVLVRIPLENSIWWSFKFGFCSTWSFPLLYHSFFLVREDNGRPFSRREAIHAWRDCSGPPHGWSKETPLPAHLDRYRSHSSG